VKQQWGKLTDNDLEYIAGKRDKFAGKLQERYGMSKRATGVSPVRCWRLGRKRRLAFGSS